MDPSAEAGIEDQLDRAVEQAGGPGPVKLQQDWLESQAARTMQSSKEAAPSEALKSPPWQVQNKNPKVKVPARLPVQADNFRDTALAVLSEELKQWHGPAQYLRKNYSTTQEIADFKDALDHHFPQQPGIVYHQSPTLPGETESVFHLRLTDLGYTVNCSSKPSPFLHTSLELLDEFLTHGVITKGDPLLLCQGPTGADAFWSVFVKGMARSSTMLFLASQAIEREWLLSTLMPDLQQSLTMICATRKIMASDPQAIAIFNAQLSQRGAIRKAHCTLTWLGKLALLQKQGLNAEQVIKAWNASATQSGALQGQKRVAVLALLQMPSNCQEVLLQHLSEFGDKTAFTEDAFANKKLQIGAKSRSGSKVWNDRLAVSKTGLKLMIDYVHMQHTKKLPGTHKKLSRDALEEVLNMAQLLVSLVGDMVSQTPISAEIIEEQAGAFFLGSKQIKKHSHVIFTYKSMCFSIFSLLSLQALDFFWRARSTRNG